MTTHLPYDVKISWTKTGILSVYEDLIDVNPAKSLLDGVNSFDLSYLASCPATSCGGATDELSVECISPVGQLMFTSDGGLFCDFDFVKGQENLKWGSLVAGSSYAQEARSFSEGVFHIPGHFVDWDDDLPGTIDEADTPAAILFTGVRSAGQRPDQTADSGLY